VDIPDPRHITSALKYISPSRNLSPPTLINFPASPYILTFRWLKSSGLDTPTLSHLKRVRKSPTGTHSTLLLTNTSPTVPDLPPILDLAPPYQLTVPRSAALTPISLALKNALWPTVFAPRRKGEPEDWTRARAQWAFAAMLRVVEEARAARAAGEVRMCLPALYLRARVPHTHYPPESPASHRVIRPITARGARMALIPSARHAHLLRAPSAPRSTQRRACSRRLDYFHLHLHLRLRLHLYHSPRRTNPISAGIDSRTSKERPTLPAHIARALHDARAMCDVLHGAIAFARQGGLLSRSDAAHGRMRRCRLCSQAGRRQPPFRDWTVEDRCGWCQR
jgi:hypothetical protein